MHRLATVHARDNQRPTQDGFIHIAASGWISVNTEEKKKQTLYTKS